MEVGGSFGQYTVLAPLVPSPSRASVEDALIAQRAAEAGFARLVVIKCLFPDTDRPKYEQHLDSTRKAASLHHPNVRQIHELGLAEGRCYLAVEYLEGVTFDTLLRGRGRAQALSDPRLHCALLAQACEGIHNAHTRPRLLHGALTPTKVFVTSGGTVKILGLGLGELAAATADPKSLADAARYSYMSPEQILGRRVDERADVFSLGIIAWESLTGRRLFSRPTRVEVYRAITEKPIPSPRALAPSVPHALDRAVARALAANPADRYKSAREFGLALEEGVGELGAPLSTVAIASIVDRCFSQELESQRTVIQRARQRLQASQGSDDDEDIFEVPTALYEGGFEPSNKTSQIPPEELERLAREMSVKKNPEPQAKLDQRIQVPDPMGDILDVPTRKEVIKPPPEAKPPPKRTLAATIPRNRTAAATAPARPAPTTAPVPAPAPAAPAAPPIAAPRPPLPERPPEPEPSFRATAAGSEPLGDLFAMPDEPAPELGPPPTSPRSFQRPPETLSDVSSVADVAAALESDFDPVPTAPPPTGLDDADAAAAAAGAEIAPDVKKSGGRPLLLVLAIILLLGAVGFAYYEFAHKKEAEPESGVSLD